MNNTSASLYTGHDPTLSSHIYMFISISHVPNVCLLWWCEVRELINTPFFQIATFNQTFTVVTITEFITCNLQSFEITFLKNSWKTFLNILMLKRGHLEGRTLTCWLTSTCTTFINRSPLTASLVNTRVVTRIYTGKAMHKLCHWLQQFYLQGCAGRGADEGSPNQLQLFHLRRSISAKPLIHYQKCMDKNA